MVTHQVYLPDSQLGFLRFACEAPLAELVASATLQAVGRLLMRSTAGGAFAGQEFLACQQQDEPGSFLVLTRRCMLAVAAPNLQQESALQWSLELADLEEVSVHLEPGPMLEKLWPLINHTAKLQPTSGSTAATCQAHSLLYPISNKLLLLQHVLGFVQVAANGQELVLLAMRPEQGLISHPEDALVRLAAPAVAGTRASPWELHLVKLQVRCSAAALQI